MMNSTMVRVRIAGSQALAPWRGNTKRRLVFSEIDDTPIPRRKILLTL